MFYGVYQGFRLKFGKRSKMIIFGSLKTIFESEQYFFEAVEAVVKSGLSLKSKHQGKLSLTKSLIHMVPTNFGFDN